MSLGALLVVVSSLAFGTLALFARRSYEAGFDQISLLFVRFSLAVIFLGIVALVRRTRLPTGSEFKGLLFMGGLYVGQSYTFFAALKHVPASTVSLLLYLYPGIVTLGAVAIYQEKMNLPKWTALACAVIGSVFIVGVSGKGNATGIAFGVGTALFYSAYLLVGTKVLIDIPPLASSITVIGTAAVVYGCLVLVQGFQGPSNSIGWFWAAFLALIPTFVAISALLAGLEKIGPVATSTLAALEPLATATLSIAFLGEQLSLPQVLGGALILTAVVVLARSRQAVSSASN